MWILAAAIVLGLVAWRVQRTAVREEPAIAPAQITSASDANRVVDPPALSERRSPATGQAVETDTVREAVEVLVLDEIGYTPVAGAEVRWANVAELGMPRNPSEYGVSYAPATFDFDLRVEPVLARELAHLATTDERGIALVDARIFPGRVSAILGDRSGSTDVDERRTSPIRVIVRAHSTITIEVVDGAGSPVRGVPVSLRQSANVGSSMLWSGTTDELGLARAEIVKPRRPDDAGWTVHAGLQIPLRQPVSAPVDLRIARAEPVRLVLPPCGSVVVDVREEDGRPATRFRVELRVAPGDPTRFHVCPDTSPNRFEPDLVRGTEARFDFVGLDLDVCASASRTNDSTRHARPGPRAAGDVVRFDLPLAGHEPELTGRFLTDAGEPLRDRLVQIVFTTQQFSSFRYPVLTDADGRFRFFASVPQQPGLTGSLLAMPIGIGAGEGGSVRTSIDFAITASARDVGDLVVRPARVVGSGTVVDDLGAPVPWPQVAVFGASPQDETGWRPTALLHSVPHADGSFEVVASIDVTRIRVVARRHGHAESEPVELDAGARDARLVAPRACEIRGRVLGAEVSQASRVRVHAIGPGPRIEGKTYRSTHLESDSFHFIAIAPGRYDLEFRGGSDGEVFHRIDGIDVPPAGKAVDARLDAIDLHTKIPLPRRR